MDKQARHPLGITLEHVRSSLTVARMLPTRTRETVLVNSATDSDGVLLSDGDYSVFLHRPVTYPDAGYRQLVDLRAEQFHGTIDATTYVNVVALDRFRDALVALYRNLKGVAELTVYENFKLRLIGDGLGHITVRVEAMAGPSMQIRLTYEFNIDQTQLPEAISALTKLTKVT